MAVRFAPHVEALPPVWAQPHAGLGRQRKVALLGSHLTIKPAPWDDPSWELWGHASSRGFYVDGQGQKRVPHRFFDLHRRECWTKTNHKGEAYLKFLRNNTVPIYMQERFKDVPAAVRYPLERIAAEFRPYFTGHAAYMIALALIEGVTHIGFFGINYGKDFSGKDSEYLTQRGSCEYWMGVAEGRGVKIVLPKGSTLLADPKELYGYESHDEEGRLVESYLRRTEVRAFDATTATPVKAERDASGRALPPPHLRETVAEERANHPRPAWATLPDETREAALACV